jgi:hypothetical protein
MSVGTNGGPPNESSLVKLYMDLTGAAESTARSVFMYVNSANEANSEMAPAEQSILDLTPRKLRAWRSTPQSDLRRPLDHPLPAAACI